MRSVRPVRSAPNLKGVTEIQHDVVVVAGVERNPAARVSDRADHVERLVPVERRDLDRDDILQLGKPPPECVREDPAAHGRLEIETHDRHD